MRRPVAAGRMPLAEGAALVVDAENVDLTEALELEPRNASMLSAADVDGMWCG